MEKTQFEQNITDKTKPKYFSHNLDGIYGIDLSRLFRFKKQQFILFFTLERHILVISGIT